MLEKMDKSSGHNLAIINKIFSPFKILKIKLMVTHLPSVKSGKYVDPKKYNNHEEIKKRYKTGTNSPSKLSQ